MRQGKRRPRDNSIGVSLFPFLAVLLCTMGALIVLLVFIAGQASLEASQPTPPPLPAAPVVVVPPEPEPPPFDREAYAQRQQLQAVLEEEIEKMKARQTALAAASQEQQAQLDAAAQRVQTLRDEQGRLAAMEAELRQGKGPMDELAQSAQQLALVERQLLDAEAAYQAKQQAAAQRKPTYAILPFEGRFETRRRPIYIECRRDAIVVQPEGVVLVEDDFRGPMGTGNGLASVVRTIGDYLRRMKHTDLGDAGRPYPLLLVRPDGIGAYYAARAALQSWDDEFGYEFVEQDWELEFHTPNPELANLTQVSLREARQRQRAFAASAPALFRKTANESIFEIPGSTPTPSNGQYAEGGPGGSGAPGGSGNVGGQGTGAYVAGASGTGQGAGYGPQGNGMGGNAGGLPGIRNGTGDGKGGSGTGGTGQLNANAFVTGGQPPRGNAGGQGSTGAYGSQGNYGTPGNFGQPGAIGLPGEAGGQKVAGSNGSYPNGSQIASPYGGQPGAGQPNVGQSGVGQPGGEGGLGGFSGGATGKPAEPDALGQGIQSPGGTASGGTPQVALSNNYQPDANNGPALNSASGTSGNGSQGSSGQASGSQAGGQAGGTASMGSPSAGGQAAAGQSSASQSAGGQTAGAQGQGMSGGAPDSAAPTVSVNQTLKRIGNAGGEAWAPAEPQPNSIGVRRDLRIECHHNRLVVLPKQTVIPLDQHPQLVQQELMAAIGGEVKRWGVAGHRMYWRPAVVFEVHGGADARYQQYGPILQQQGLDISAERR